MYAFLGDIQANREALDATLDAIAECNVCAWYSLGDIVGAGGSPTSCLDRVRRQANGAILGADDAAVGGVIDTSYLNGCADDLDRQAGELGTERLTWIRNLPRAIDLPGLNIRLSFGVPGSMDFDPLHSALQLRRSWRDCQMPQLTVVGGTHIPRLFAIEGDWVFECPTEATTLAPERSYVLCPGSIGQPHDYDHRASWVTFDPARRHLRFHRTDYDVQTAARKIRQRSLIPTNAERLVLGV